MVTPRLATISCIYTIMQPSGEQVRNALDLANAQGKTVKRGGLQHLHQEGGDPAFLLGSDEARLFVGAFLLVDAEAHLGQTVVAIEAVIFLRAIERGRMKHGNNSGLESGILQSLESAHGELPCRLAIAGAPAAAMEARGTMEAQPPFQIRPPKQRDPPLVDRHPVRLHGKTGARGSDRDQPLMRMLEPSNGGRGGLARVPDDHRRGIRGHGPDDFFANSLDDLRRHQAMIVAMPQVAVGAVDIAKRRGLQDDELGPDRHQQLSHLSFENSETSARGAGSSSTDRNCPEMR